MEKTAKSPKKVILTILILCGLVILTPFTVKTYNNHNYNNCLVKGQECLIEGNYEEAVYNFDNALKYRKNETDEIKKLIDRAIILNLSMHAFEDGAKLFYDKKYDEAISAYEKVNIEDNLRYDVAQEKIKECKKVYSTTNITAAKNEALNLNYDKAISYLNSVLRLDPENQEAIALKTDYINKFVTTVST